MEPPNNGHVGTRNFVLYREVFLSSEVKYIIGKWKFWDVKPFPLKRVFSLLYQRFHCMYYLNVSEYFCEDLVLRHSEHRVVIIWMGAHVDDAVHVKIEIVKLWDLNVGGEGG